MEEKDRRKKTGRSFRLLMALCFCCIGLCFGKADTVKAETVVGDGEEVKWGNEQPIRLVSGDWRVKGVIKITGNVTVFCPDGNCRFYNDTRPGDNGERYPMFAVDPGAELTLINVTLDGNGVPSDSSSCVVVHGASNAQGTLKLLGNTKIYGSTLLNGGGGHGVYGNQYTKIYMKENSTIYNCQGYGIGTYGNVEMESGSIHDCLVGISANNYGGNTQNGNLTMTGGDVYNNRGYGLETNSGTITMSGGYVHGNQQGIATSKGTVNISKEAVVCENTDNGVYAAHGTVNVSGGQIRSNGGNGIQLYQQSSAELSGGDIFLNSNGVYSTDQGNVTLKGATLRQNNRSGIYAEHGNRVRIESGNVYLNGADGVSLANSTAEMTGGSIRSNGYQMVGSGFSKISDASGIRAVSSTVTISGGESCTNSRNGVDVVSAGNLTVSGSGSIYGNAAKGIYETLGSTVTMTGGSVRDNHDADIWEEGNSTVKWTGGTCGSNGLNVWHDGKEGETGLVVGSGANGGNSISVYLTGKDRYVTADSSHPFGIAIPDDCYFRGKKLIHTGNGTQASGACNNLTFDKKGAFTKRAKDNDVVVWDKYTQTTEHRKFNPDKNTWEKSQDAVKEDAWGGDSYTPKYGTTPQYYRNYALTMTDPNQAMPAEGSTVTVSDVSSENTFYACYYPNRYTIHFDGNGATSGNTKDQEMLYGVAANLNANGFQREFDVAYDVNGGSSVEKSGDHAVSDFIGWKVSPAAINPSYSDRQLVKNIAEPGKTRTLYAGWRDNAVTLPNASKADEYQVVDEEHKGWVKYYFLGWYTAPEGGKCVGRGGDAYTPKANVTLYAHWSYKVCIYYDGNTNDGGGMAMDDPAKGDIKPYGQTYTIRENGYSKTGYDFFGWNTAQVDGAGNLIENGKEAFAPGSAYNEDIPLTLFAAWRNRFDIAYMGICQTEGDDYFDNNGGNDYSQLSDTVKLGKAEDMKTVTTKSFFDSETGEEVVMDVTGTGVGWAFAKDIEAKYKEAYIEDDTEYTAAEFFELARDAGAFTYGSVSEDYKGTVPALNSPDMAVANMYRVWDYGPLVEAYDLYYTLDQAQSGYITEAELLSHAKATDEEDGEITGGDHADKGNSFHVMDYSETDFTSFTTTGSVTETYLATDSVGNQTKKRVTVHIVDTVPEKVLPEGTTRFVSGKYYELSHEEGGLKEDSVWKTNPEYRVALEKTFENQKSGTPEETYTFSHADILKMQEYIKENGFGNTKSPDALEQFYRQFME